MLISQVHRRQYGIQRSSIYLQLSAFIPTCSRAFSRSLQITRFSKPSAKAQGRQSTYPRTSCHRCSADWSISRSLNLPSSTTSPR